MARTVFSLDTEDDIKTRIEKTINDSDIGQLRTAYESQGLSDKISYTLMSLNIDDDLKKFKLDFASHFIQTRIARRFEIDTQNGLIRFIDDTTRVRKVINIIAFSKNFYYFNFLKDMPSFGNWKGMLFEIVFERFITDQKQDHLCVIDLEKSARKSLLVENIDNIVIVEKAECLECSDSFRKMVKSKGAENTLWKLPKLYPTFDFLAYDSQKKVIHLYQVTTQRDHSLNWIAQTNEYLDVIDPSKKEWRVEFFFATTQQNFKIAKKKEINAARLVHQYSLLVGETKIH